MHKFAPFPLVLALLCAALASDADAGTYKWVDKDGKVHYSDQPVAGAQKVDLPPITEVPSVPTEAPAPADDDGKPPEPLDSATSYTSMTITSPAAGETLRGSGMALTISVELNPGLGGDDRIEYLLDGAVVPQTVPNIERGTHTVSARVVSPDGATKISATPVSFTVFQNIATQPTAKPKPKKP